VITVESVPGLADDIVDDAVWTGLIADAAGAYVFQTRPWLRAWNATLARGPVQTLVARDGQSVVGVLPIVSIGGHVYFAGVGGADRMAVLTANIDVAAELVRAALDLAPSGTATFHHVLAGATTHDAIRLVGQEAATRLAEEYRIANPVITDLPNSIADLSSRRSLCRARRWFEANGRLEIRHHCDADLAHRVLPVLFDQHLERWRDTPTPSLFSDGTQRSFFRRLVDEGSSAGWLRCTEVRWNDRVVAAHIGTSFAGRYLWYKPSFEQSLAKRSPGEVLLRSLFIAAAEERSSVFDFGNGDEAFKHRFADTDEMMLAIRLERTAR
jgi:CelD/BcsL family acetyltransferase involved in cellulose biosynthesis